MSLEYKIVSDLAWDMTDFVETVHENVRAGWEPTGGVGVRTAANGDPVIYQAMIRRKDEDLITHDKRVAHARAQFPDESAPPQMSPLALLDRLSEIMRPIPWSVVAGFVDDQGQQTSIANVTALTDFVTAVRNLYAAAKEIRGESSRFATGEQRLKLDTATDAFEGVKVSHEVQAPKFYVHATCGQTLSFPTDDCAKCSELDPYGDRLSHEQQG